MQCLYIKCTFKAILGNAPTNIVMGPYVVYRRELLGHWQAHLL